MAERKDGGPNGAATLVNGEAPTFDFIAPENLYALKWNGAAEHVEFTKCPKRLPWEAEYTETVAPHPTRWKAERTRRAADRA